jgi:hypothetical protein
MNYGPLEFADYLRRNESHTDSAMVRAARAAKPQPATPENLLSVRSGPGTLTVRSPSARIEAVSVYEAVAVNPPSVPPGPGMVSVLVRDTRLPVVLVLSSHQAVEWRVTCAPGAVLAALLISGFGDSTVVGALEAPVHRIGGFYAFRRGSAEYQHLESEVLRCTGRSIDSFQSVYAGSSFEIG